MNKYLLQNGSVRVDICLKTWTNCDTIYTSKSFALRFIHQEISWHQTNDLFGDRGT